MLVFMRHGKDNSKHRDKHDPPLVDGAEVQIRRKTRYLAQKYGFPDIIFYSPMRRCRQTHEIVISELVSMGAEMPEYHRDKRLSRYFFDKEKLSPKINRRTWSENIPIAETKGEFKMRVRDFCDEMSSLSGFENIWCITHTKVFLSIMDMVGEKSRYLEFADHMVIDKSNMESKINPRHRGTSHIGNRHRSVSKR